MPYIQVDVDLDEFDTRELVDEIVQRFKSYGKRQLDKKQKDELKKELEELWRKLGMVMPEDLPNQSLEDKMKIDFILSVWHKYTSWQLEEKLK